MIKLYFLGRRIFGIQQSDWGMENESSTLYKIWDNFG